LFNPEESVVKTEDEVVETHSPPKKHFIEPEITVPVDVLEATTFFQSVTSGTTN
jgi:hypothetical protein